MQVMPKVEILVATAEHRSQMRQIDEVSFFHPWTDEDWEAHRWTFQLVAVKGREVMGFAVAELHHDCRILRKVAVAPAYRRQGVGTGFVRSLSHRRKGGRRSSLRAAVREGNVGAQLWLQSCGFL